MLWPDGCWGWQAAGIVVAHSLSSMIAAAYSEGPTHDEPYEDAGFSCRSMHAAVCRYGAGSSDHTLSCGGEYWKGGYPLVYRLGVVVSGNAVSFSGLTIPIREASPSEIDFAGRAIPSVVMGLAVKSNVSRNIDRITGDMTAMVRTRGKTTSLQLDCKPGSRLF
jgi:hypothetical protein